MLGQNLIVEKREHPPGDKGIQSSLEEVAKKISEGYTHPEVRAWSIERLDRARKEEGIKVNTERERAEILLRAVQKKLWVPDPVGVEFMVGAHLMACDVSTKDKVCFHGEDCDGVTSLLGACFLSVGLDTMVVGHAYKGRDIEHVLCAVRINKKWWYADPSTDFPVGTCAKYSWERLLSVPNIQTLCNDVVCLRDQSAWEPDKHDFVKQGTFVGVNGQIGLGAPPRLVQFAWIAGRSLRWNREAA